MNSKLDVKNITLPTLGRGEGSISFTADETRIMYRKTYKGKRLTSYGFSVLECVEKMREKEKEYDLYLKTRKANDSGKSRQSKNDKLLLKNSMQNWIVKYKKNDGKRRSYDRNYCTFENQIKKYPIANLQVNVIDADTIVNHLDMLIKKEYSHSVIKKTYQLLNQYFSYMYLTSPMENPMLGLKCPKQDAIKKPVKEIEILTEAEITEFTRVALSRYKNGKSVYWWGEMLVILLYTGMRIGEACALKWKDIDFNAGRIRIDESLSVVIDYDKDPEDDAKYSYETIYTSPKNKTSIRTIYVADLVLLLLRYIQKYKNETTPSPDDYVFLTIEGNQIKHARNIRRALNAVETRAKLHTTNDGFHMLRHSFVSMMCRKGVDKKKVADMVGHKSTFMIEIIYQHILATEIIEAAHTIDERAALNTIVNSYVVEYAYALAA